jgi:hypothetical protein
METEKLINIFNEIQKIPYHISVAGEPGFDCEDKAKMLIERLGKEGIQAEQIVGLFRWSDLELPQEISSIGHSDECSHSFVQINNEVGDPIYIDPTWNPELAAAGFVVAKWDGISSTEIALPCYKIFTSKDSLEYLQTIDYEKDIEDNGSFYEAFNDYCDSFLTKGM